MKKSSGFIANLDIQNKIFLSGSLIILLFVGVISIYFLPAMRSNMMENKKQNLKNIVNSTITFLNTINDDYTSGKISLEEAKSMASSRLSHVRYGPDMKDYLWVNDFRPQMIMHPYVQTLYGKDLTDYEDHAGKKLFSEFVRVCRENGEGFVDYMWQWQDDKDRIVEKISFVKTFEPWGWIIGTGVYIEDIKDEIRLIVIKSFIIVFIITFIMLFILYKISKSITRPLNMVIKSLKEISIGIYVPSKECVMPSGF